MVLNKSYDRVISIDDVFKENYGSLSKNEQNIAKDRIRSDLMEYLSTINLISRNFLSVNLESSSSEDYDHKLLYTLYLNEKRINFFLQNDDNLINLYNIQASITFFMSSKTKLSIRSGKKITLSFKEFYLSTNFIKDKYLQVFGAPLMDKLFYTHISVEFYLVVFQINYGLYTESSLKTAESESSFFKEDLLRSLDFSFASFMMVIASCLDIKLMLSNVYYMFCAILSYLEFSSIVLYSSKKITNSEKRKKSVQNISLYTFAHNVSFNDSMILSFPIHSLDCALYAPIVFVNNFLVTGNIRIGQVFQVCDYVFEFNSLFSNNYSYGFIKQTVVYDDLGNQYLNNEKKNAIEEFNFNNPDYFEFLKFIKTENRTKAYIDLDRFDSVVNDFIHYSGLKSLGFSFKTPTSDLVFWLRTYGGSISSDLKDDIFNIGKLLSLILFKEHVISYKISKKVHKNSINFYHLFFFDFRGRKYTRGNIFITTFVPSRFFIYYGFYSKNDVTEVISMSLETKAFKIVKKLLFNNKHLLDHNSHYFHPYFNIGVDGISSDFILNVCSKVYTSPNERVNPESCNLYCQSLLVYTLISIGIIFKTALLELNTHLNMPNRSIIKDVNTVFDDSFVKNDFNIPDHLSKITILEFFLKGLEEYTNYIDNLDTYFITKNFDLEEVLRLKTYFDLIISFPNLFKKSMIGLDVSCSAYQVRVLINSNARDEDFIESNIAGLDSVYDIYSLMLNRFKASEINSQKSKLD